MIQLLIWHLKVFVASAILMSLVLFIYISLIDKEGGLLLHAYFSIGYFAFCFYIPFLSVIISFFGSLKYRSNSMRFILFAAASIWFFVAMNLISNSFEHFAILDFISSLTYPSILLYNWYKETDIEIFQKAEEMW
ncbi:MAG: hypothetical protein RL204_460 [Bacteroidota bacterium]|jgi:hypothetical protein